MKAATLASEEGRRHSIGLSKGVWPFVAFALTARTLMIEGEN
jgi:hypothetical protein